MTTPKRRILSFVFTVLCLKKSLLIIIIIIIVIIIIIIIIKEVEWIEEVREEMEDVVPEVPTDGWNLIIFFEVLRSLDLITKVEPWFSQVTPKPLYENEHATAFWDVPLFAIKIFLTYFGRSYNLMDSYMNNGF